MTFAHLLHVWSHQQVKWGLKYSLWKHLRGCWMMTRSFMKPVQLTTGRTAFWLKKTSVLNLRVTQSDQFFWLEKSPLIISDPIPPPQRWVFLTFDCDLSCSLDHAQGGYGHTGVIGRLADVGELQYIAANGHLILPGQLHFTTYPLDVRHGSADCNAGQVDAASGHHLMIGGGDGETGRHTANCGSTEEQSERRQRRRVGWRDHWTDSVFDWVGFYCAPQSVNWSGLMSLVEFYSLCLF